MLDGAHRYFGEGVARIGLDRRPRPTSMRARITRGLIQSAPFSSLQRRIIFFNLIGLALLVLGILYLNQFRTGLIEQRVQALRTQGEIIALTLAEDPALMSGGGPVRADAMARTLERLARPTGVRARYFDRNLTLVADTQAGAPPVEPEADGARIFETLEQAYLRLVTMFRSSDGASELSMAARGREAAERAVARGEIVQTIHVAAEGEPILSVALPIGRGASEGVLMLSTEGEDINQVVRRERVVILQVFLIATAVSVALSVLLANTIASPIRRLAEAADPAAAGGGRAIRPERTRIPDMTQRTDEIGDLSAAMIRMTQALYRRIEAIESFAADVAHEIKNPLTSLRSAVETLPHTTTPAQRERLAEVIKQDVDRLDRLVTDISNASRLDAELVRERMQKFDLGQLVTTLATMTEMRAAERDVRVATRLPSDPLMARGLESRIAQVITNLLDNALSFSPPSGTIRIEGRRTRGGGVRLDVLDQGPGIPEDSLEAIFTRFYSERPAEESYGNHSGLGLSISKQIVEAHSGRIHAENRLNPADPDAPPVGARFVIELPG
ncbi:MAG TPA: ATP-binding protein [Thermohalobaculum sp.]|nr:ATP-binding protein [Thermohalobaculum sp.]